LLRHAENKLNSEKLLRTSLIDRRTEDNCSAQVNGEPGQVTDVLFDQKLELATEGLEPYYLDHLKNAIIKRKCAYYFKIHFVDES
jgi:hypothetical protein